MELNKFAKRLKEAREENGMSQSELGKLIKRSDSIISRYESGVHEPKRINIKEIASILQVNPAWLFGADVEKYAIINKDTKCKVIPVVGTIAAGSPIVAEENTIEYDCVPINSTYDFALKVKGDSMIGARIYDGDTVYIQKQSHANNGDIVAVIVDNENATLKRFYKEDNRIILHAENPNIPDLIFNKSESKEVHILGKAVIVKFNLR